MMMTKEELETITEVARELVEFTSREIDKTNQFLNDTLFKWLEITKKQAETTLWVCDELRNTESRVREQVAQDLLDVDPVEWALAGQQAGHEAAKVARGEKWE